MRQLGAAFASRAARAAAVALTPHRGVSTMREQENAGLKVGATKRRPAEADGDVQQTNMPKIHSTLNMGVDGLLSLDTDQPTVYIAHTPPLFLQALCQGLRISNQPPVAGQVFDRFGMPGSVR